MSAVIRPFGVDLDETDTSARLRAKVRVPRFQVAIGAGVNRRFIISAEISWETHFYRRRPQTRLGHLHGRNTHRLRLGGERMILQRPNKQQPGDQNASNGHACEQAPDAAGFVLWKSRFAGSLDFVGHQCGHGFTIG